MESQQPRVQRVEAEAIHSSDPFLRHRESDLVAARQEDRQVSASAKIAKPSRQIHRAIGRKFKKLNDQMEKQK
jgi:hypothetical protein